MAYIKCQHKCPGGQSCRCDGAIKHALHLCSDKTCSCHTARRYGLERRIVGGREVYAVAGEYDEPVRVLEVGL